MTTSPVHMYVLLCHQPLGLNTQWILNKQSVYYNHMIKSEITGLQQYTIKDNLIQLDQFSVEQNLLKFRSEIERCGIVQGTGGDK